MRNLATQGAGRQGHASTMSISPEAGQAPYASPLGTLDALPTQAPVIGCPAGVGSIQNAGQMPAPPSPQSRPLVMSHLVVVHCCASIAGAEANRSTWCLHWMPVSYCADNMDRLSCKPNQQEINCTWLGRMHSTGRAHPGAAAGAPRSAAAPAALRAQSRAGRPCAGAPR